MEKLQQLLKTHTKFWLAFSKTSDCKKCLKKLKTLGYKWFNNEQIDLKCKLNFFFTLEICTDDKKIGFVPNYQRFSKKIDKNSNIPLIQMF